MIAYLEGQILRIETNLIIIKTSTGVGYEVNVLKQLSSNSSSEENINLHIYTNVKEDEISLYGFENIEQKELFTMLIKTSGIGPKLGLAILSVMSPSEIVKAVHQNSVESFSQVSGIGKKTATKLCLDLKDKLKSSLTAQSVYEKDFKCENKEIESGSGKNSVFSALKNLGYNENEIIKALGKSENVDLSFEEKLKKALSLLTPLR